MSDQTDTLQKQQAEYWGGEGGERWLSQADRTNRMLAPITKQLMAVAAPQSGERIVDIGCGTGDTTLILAEMVGAEGHVLGVDISEGLLTDARRKADAMADINVQFKYADASAYDFAGEEADLVFSRFGVMFFGDPEGAFANIHAALKPAGRLTFVCWQAMPLSPFFNLAFQAALEILPRPEPVPEGTPGPFAFAKTDWVHAILEAGGFSRVDISSPVIDMTIPVGADADLKETATRLAALGPVGRMLMDQDEGMKARVVEKVTVALAREKLAGAITLGGAVHIVTAKA